jgi:hypothetical protein
MILFQTLAKDRHDADPRRRLSLGSKPTQTYQRRFPIWDSATTAYGLVIAVDSALALDQLQSQMG